VTLSVPYQSLLALDGALVGFMPGFTLDLCSTPPMTFPFAT
jgi:hypothetical protein